MNKKEKKSADIVVLFRFFWIRSYCHADIWHIKFIIPALIWIKASQWCVYSWNAQFFKSNNNFNAWKRTSWCSIRSPLLRVDGFLDSSDDHPASPPSRPTSNSISSNGSRFSRWGRFPSQTHFVHKDLDVFELGCELGETSFQGVELLVEISQGVRQRLDPAEGNIL